MKDLKDSLNEQLNIITEGALRCDGKINKVKDGNSEVTTIEDRGAEHLYVMYDEDSGSMDIISTSDIKEYSLWAGEEENNAAKLAALKPGDVIDLGWSGRFVCLK